jgi:hypothetical protein
MTLEVNERVKVTYKKLKQMVYYEKHPLTLRRRIAEFEFCENFEERLQEIASVIQLNEPHKL